MIEPYLVCKTCSRTSEATYSAEYELKFDYDPSTEELAADIINKIEEMNGRGGIKRTKIDGAKDGAHAYVVKGTYQHGKLKFKSNRRLVLVMPFTLAIILGMEADV